ncbi:unnamed protein product, partial [marine sediment metagenome]
YQGKAALGQLELRRATTPTLERFLTGPCKRTLSEIKNKDEISRLLGAFADLRDRPLDKIGALDVARYARASVKAGLA